MTHAEWALFQAAGGYEDEQWWRTPDAKAWRNGEGTASGIHNHVMYWWRHFKADPGQLEEAFRIGMYTEQVYRRWCERLLMTADALTEHLHDLYPGGPLREPLHWTDKRFDGPTQPVVGVCWYEARTYCAWLAANTGLGFRPATEVEWEATARGTAGRRYAYGDQFRPTWGNTLETHVRRPSPVGVFVEGATPEGAHDMTGNVFEWTASLFGRDNDVPDFGYPYDGTDGGEQDTAGTDVRRLERGGCWGDEHYVAVSYLRASMLPSNRTWIGGFRVAAPSCHSDG